MTILSNLTFAAALIVALLYLPMLAAGTSGLRSAMKTAPVLLLALAAWLADAPALLIAGFALSALGDLALSRDGRAAFLYGVAAFALAHLLFILLFLNTSGLALTDAFASAPLAGVFLLGLALSGEVWLIPHTNGLRWPVRGYVTVICAMMLAALTLPPAYLLAVVGAALFLCSDLALAVRMFRMDGTTKSARGFERFVWISYIGAQALIFWGIAGV